MVKTVMILPKSIYKIINRQKYVIKLKNHFLAERTVRITDPITARKAFGENPIIRKIFVIGKMNG